MKTALKSISTSFWCMQHPKAGQNTQHSYFLSFFLSSFYIHFMKATIFRLYLSRSNISVSLCECFSIFLCFFCFYVCRVFSLSNSSPFQVKVGSYTCLLKMELQCFFPILKKLQALLFIFPFPKTKTEVFGFVILFYLQAISQRTNPI